MNPYQEKGHFPARPRRAACIAVFALLVLNGCDYVPKVDPYRMEILQGNYVTQDMVSKLEPGMTRDQVRFALGTPLVVDTFRDNRWDYVFVRMPENTKVAERRRISVFFNDDRLLRIEGDVVAGVTPPVAAPESGADTKSQPAGTTQ